VVGNNASSYGNSVIVFGAGLTTGNSTWNATNELYVGYDGSSNSLSVIQGTVLSGDGYVGYGPSSSGNVVIVTGNAEGPAWWYLGNPGCSQFPVDCTNSLYVGYDGTGNFLQAYAGGLIGASNVVAGVNTDAVGNVIDVEYAYPYSTTNTGILGLQSQDLVVGDASVFNRLYVHENGAVISLNSVIGNQPSSSNNQAQVYDYARWNAGSLTLGEDGSGNSLTISNGGVVVCSQGIIGAESNALNNVATVTGGASVWSVAGQLDVGLSGGTNQLIIANNGSVFASNLVVGVNASSTSNLVTISGGTLAVTNQAHNGTLEVRHGRVVLNSGTLTVDPLVVTNGAGVFLFAGGTYFSAGTTVSNGQLFAVGNGASAATFQLDGGIHSFGNTLEVRNDATLAGCGTVSGNVVVDAGGRVLINCGGKLTFTGGIVTNKGTILVTNGSVLEAYSNFVNNGTIDITNGSTNFHGTFTNNGTIVGGNSSGSAFEITSIALQGNNLLLTWTTTGGNTNFVQASPGVGNGSYATNFLDISSAIVVVGNGTTTTNYLDVGGATNRPARYYRIRGPASNSTNQASIPLITSITRTNGVDGNNDILIKWNTNGTTNNHVQVTTGTANGSFSTNAFANLANIVVTSPTTNYLDVGGATNTTTGARYYRISSP
jgi:T5SS/PEP-CTERM-associated repeat protein